MHAQVKMAKNPATVFSFLADLEAKLKPLGEAEKIKLLELKKAEHEKRGWEFDGELKLWDYRYYDRLYTERTLSLGESFFSGGEGWAPKLTDLTFALTQTRTRFKSTLSYQRLCPRFWTSTVNC